MLDQSQKEALYKEIAELVGYTEDDNKRLAELGDLMAGKGQALVDKFYGHLERIDGTKVIINQGDRRAKLEKSLKQWFDDLFSGKRDASYAERMLHVGYVHVKQKVDQKYVTAMFGFIMDFIYSILAEAYGNESDKYKTYSESVSRIITIDMTLMTETYIDGIINAAGWSMDLLKNMAATTGDD